MTLQKWIEDRAIHGFPTFSVEDVRAADLCSSEQILQNELSRLSSNKTIASVYRGYYVIIPTQYVPKRRVVSTRNVTIDWYYRDGLPEEALITKNTETGTIRISNPLLTAADLVQYQQHVGGLSRVATILEELSEQIDINNQFAPLATYVKKVVWHM